MKVPISILSILCAVGCGQSPMVPAKPEAGVPAQGVEGVNDESKTVKAFRNVARSYLEDAKRCLRIQDNALAGAHNREGLLKLAVESISSDARELKSKFETFPDVRDNDTLFIAWEGCELVHRYFDLAAGFIKIAVENLEAREVKFAEASVESARDCFARAVHQIESVHEIIGPPK